MWQPCNCWTFQDGHHPLLISVSTNRLNTLKNIGLDTKILFLSLRQVILHPQLSFVTAMLDFQDGHHPLLISVSTSRLGTLINIGLDNKMVFMSLGKVILHAKFDLCGSHVEFSRWQLVHFHFCLNQQIGQPHKQILTQRSCLYLLNETYNGHMSIFRQPFWTGPENQVQPNCSMAACCFHVWVGSR